MKCTICQSGSLDVVNSRKHATDLRVWRRRKCRQCAALITTIETVDYDRAFNIRHSIRKGGVVPFEKSILITQLFAAGGHIAKQHELFYVAETIALRAFVKASDASFIIDATDYYSIAKKALEAYNKLLAANFEARLDRH